MSNLTLQRSMIMDEQIIERSAIGRFAKIGDLYDATSDWFCDGSIFDDKMPFSAIKAKSYSIPITFEQIVKNDTFVEKFDKMNVCPELQVSILSRLIPDLCNSGRFLDHHKRSMREVKCSVVSVVKTKEEDLDLLHIGLKNFITTNPNVVQTATHFVIGISKGASSAVSFHLKCDDEARCIEDHKILSSHLQKILNQESLHVDPSLNKMLSRVWVTLCSDILTRIQEHSCKFSEGIEFLNSLPRQAAKSPKPLSYKLVPINVVLNNMSMRISSPISYHQLNTSIAARILEIFDNMLLANQIVHDNIQDVTKYTCIPKEHMEAVQKQLTVNQTCFKKILNHAIASIRSATSNEVDLEKIIDSYHKTEKSPQTLFKELKFWDNAQMKIKFAKKIKSEGAEYIGQENTLSNDDFIKNEKTSVVFYFNHALKSQNQEQWNNNCHMFFGRLKTKCSETRYYAVDCEFHKTFSLKSRNSCITVYKDRKIIVNDMLAYQDREGTSEVCWIKLTSEPRIVLTEPKRLGPLTVICPCMNMNSDPINLWHCTVCFEPLNYGFDGNLYCDCGLTSTKHAEFKCSSMLHGKVFQRHQEEPLTQHLQQIIPFSETNLLILGGTGVGKSTWINSFINFLTYESISEAKAGGLCTLIPSHFTAFDENYMSAVVRTGFSENEMYEVGHSATQHSRVYKFQIGNEIIRLIDTPGIGDTRGIEQDKENFEDILQTIANIDELHGICILQMPNNARIDVVFRFCIKELLTNLHRDASKNIVFCFTNTRGTSYRPGETMPALQALLQENPSMNFELNKQTVYCFDSEAYRFLATILNDPPLQVEADYDNAEKSWNKSMAETKRMLAYINSLKPHETTRTLDITHARELVLNLTRPLGDISRHIHINKSILENDLQEIKDASIEDLKKRRFTTRTEIRSVPLEYPRTVCSNSECVNYRTIGDMKITEYEKICHHRCTLKNVTRDTIGNPRLMNCWAFKESSDNKCRRCTHPYTEHVHIYYESKHTLVEVEDQSVKEDLNAAQMKQNMISERETLIEKFEEERKEVEQASLKFACFLKCNAITPYNDGMEEYLTHLIRQEKEKVAQIGNCQVLERLERSLRSYIEERKILEMAIATGQASANVLNPTDIENLVSKLKQLELCGPFLKGALDCIGKTRAAVFQTVQNQKCIKTKNKHFISWAARKLMAIKNQLDSM